MALIRCKQCGNPVSSKSKACPICGEPITTPDTPTTTPTEEVVTQAPKTLNDILAERQNQRTLNDEHAEESKETTPQNETATPTPTNEESPKEDPKETVYNTPIYDNSTYSDAEVDDLKADLERNQRSLKGYRLIAILLLVLLIPAAYFSINYGLKNKSIEADYAIVQSARQLFEEQNALLQRDAESLVTELESLKDQNDTMLVKYQEAVVMLEQLQKEKTYNYNQLAKYKREVETLRGVMKGYLKQIDSLNTINSNLQAQNVAYKKEITSAQLRADVAEERASELQNKVAQGSVLRARDITLVALNANDKEITRVKNAATLRVDFTVGANELAKAGNRQIYLCITSPDGYLLSTDAMPTFSYQGTKKGYSASREVDYQNEDVDVSIYYKGSGFIPGTYKIAIYMDGNQIGTSEVAVR